MEPPAVVGLVLRVDLATGHSEAERLDGEMLGVIVGEPA